MFAGHYGVSFLIKSQDKGIPLWALFLAVQFVDILWAAFCLSGIEKFRIIPGITESNPLDLYFMPYTHSLGGSLLWAIIAAGIFYIFFRKRKDNPVKSASLIFIAVFSHWFVDLIVHRPDLPLLFDSHKVGFGLWNYLAFSIAAELIFLAAGLIFYYRSSSAISRIGKFSMGIFAGLMSLVYLGSIFGPAPESPNAMASSALASFLAFALIAGILERGGE